MRSDLRFSAQGVSPGIGSYVKAGLTVHTLPNVLCIAAIALTRHGDSVRNQERGEESHSDHADHVDIVRLGLAQGLDEIHGS